MKHHYYYLPQGQYLTWWVLSFTSSQSCLCSIYKSTLCIQKHHFFPPSILFWWVIAHDIANVAHTIHTRVLPASKCWRIVSAPRWDASRGHVRDRSERRRQFLLCGVCDDGSEGEAGGSHVRKQVAAVSRDVAGVGDAAVSFTTAVPFFWNTRGSNPQRHSFLIEHSHNNELSTNMSACLGGKNAKARYIWRLTEFIFFQ